MGFTDRFGGITPQAAEVSYRFITLEENLATEWPAFGDDASTLPRLADVDPLQPDLVISLPDATLGSKGDGCLIMNVGSNELFVQDFDGNSIASVLPGVMKYFYLKYTDLSMGLWGVIAFGTGTSALDAGALAGFGLRSLNNTLNVAPVVQTVPSDYTVLHSDRAKVLVWTGGAGALELPDTSLFTVENDFVFAVRNEGTGTLTLNPVGGATIDSSVSGSFQPGESALVHAGSGEWYTVGRGRSAQFSFTLLVKSVNGGSDTLTPSEASNVVQEYTGVLLSNQDIIFPPVVQIYYVQNQTSGAFDLTFKTAGVGTTVAVPTGQNAILFCDGVNVVNCSTSIAGFTSLNLPAGSAAVPVLTSGGVLQGLFSPGANLLGFAINGLEVIRLSATGLVVTSAAATATGGVISAANDALTVLDRPAGKVGKARWRTGGLDRWSLEANSTAESGSNAGSDMVLRSYDDAGSAIEDVMTANRAAGTVTIPKLVGGKQTIWVPARALIARQTGGATGGVTEGAANKNMLVSLDFSNLAANYAQVEIGMSKQWNLGTFSARLKWSPYAGATAFDVKWLLRMSAVGDDEDWDPAWGTTVSVVDTGSDVAKAYRTAETGAITPSGTISQFDAVKLEVYRDPVAEAADTLDVFARLHGLWLTYTMLRATDD